MEEWILEPENLSKQYGSHLAADQVSFRIRKNAVYGLLGPDGAGKFTILKMITGLVRPSGGRIFFEGRPWTPRCRKKIGALIVGIPLFFGVYGLVIQNMMQNSMAVENQNTEMTREMFA